MLKEKKDKIPNPNQKDCKRISYLSQAEGGTHTLLKLLGKTWPVLFGHFVNLNLVDVQFLNVELKKKKRGTNSKDLSETRWRERKNRDKRVKEFKGRTRKSASAYVAQKLVLGGPSHRKDLLISVYFSLTDTKSPDAIAQLNAKLL